ncbi:MAG: phosphohydrolase [Taibaiella sp.]|nr:phosphohydrolase [Taibaiella sp.]
MEFEKVKKFILAKLRKELPRSLTYHSLGHIKDVYKAAQKLAKLEGVSGEELTLLLTAVLFHDSGFLIQQKEHERVGCDIAWKYLPEYGYSEKQIEVICGMIMATRIPQTPHNKLEQIICDADLDYLGRDDFFAIGNTLYDELCMYGLIQTENDWNKLQVRFLEGHHYFTDSAIKLRKEKKDSHLAYVRSKIV